MSTLAETYFAMAVVLERQGRFNLAKLYLQRALREDRK